MGIFRKYAFLALAAFGLTAGQANATIITSASNNPLNFSWSYSSVAGALTGNGTMTVSGFSSSALSLLITLNNTSLLGSNRLTSFGFGIDPNATGVSFIDAADGGIINASLANIPSLATVEVCAFGGPNCSGGGPVGLVGGSVAGSTDTFTVVLAGTWGSSVDVAPLGFKYQTGSGSFEFTTTGVPEPGSMPMLIMSLLSLLGFGYLGLRRARA